MYKYEYETVSYTLDGWGPLGGNDYQIGEYRAMIDNSYYCSSSDVNY